jgi:hypothetical protein
VTPEYPTEVEFKVRATPKEEKSEKLFLDQIKGSDSTIA